MAEVHGYYDPKFAPWEKDTIVNVFSSTKTLTSLAILVLVDRGLLDVNKNVAHYWPEFAQNGKENVKVRHLLSHTSGLAGWEEKMTIEGLYDFQTATDMLARQAPWWTPGTASGYHSISMGYLLGELVRRVTGKTMTDFVAEEIAVPLGADFQICAAEKDWPRFSNLVPPTKLPTEGTPAEFTTKVLFNPALDATISATPGWRRAEIGAANGHSNARGMMRMLSVIALGGEANGKRLLSPKTIDLIFQEQANGLDLVTGVPIRFGIGFGLSGGALTDNFLPAGNICFLGGWGGSMMIIDVDKRLTIAYAMNKMGSNLMGNNAALHYVKAIYAALTDPDT